MLHGGGRKHVNKIPQGASRHCKVIFLSFGSLCLCHNAYQSLSMYNVYQSEKLQVYKNITSSQRVVIDVYQ